MKKTIEQLLKPVILTDIQSLLTQAGADGDLYTLKLTNDLKFQEKAETRFTISAIIKTGQGTRSDIPGINALQSSIMIIFQMDANYVQEFLTIINTYCSLTNAYKSTVVDDLSDDDTETSITYEYRFSWGLATPTGTPFDVNVAVTGEPGVTSETIQMEQVILTGSVYYSDVLKMDDNQLYLYIPAKGYIQVIGIQDYEDDLSPMVTSTSLVDQYQPEYDVTGDTLTGTYNLIRIPGDEVHDYLVKLMHSSRTSSSFDMNVKILVNSLSITETDVPVILSNIKLRKVQGFEYISFSLTRR